MVHDRGGEVITKKGGRGSPMHRHELILAEKVRNLKYGGKAT